MLQRNGVTYEFHHMGFPTSEVRTNERFSAQFGMYTSDGDGELFPVQWHRFTPDSPLHALIRTLPHAAFRVNDLEKAISSLPILLAPYEPIDGYRVAIIEHAGTPVEFFETGLSDQELWHRARSGEQASLYQTQSAIR